MFRRDRENLERQLDAVGVARRNLYDRLVELEDAAEHASKAARSRTLTPAMDLVAAANLAVERAAEALDIAVYDLQTAGGEDG